MSLKKMILTLALTGSNQAMAAQCFIIGQDAQNENSYNQLIKFIPDVEFKTQGQILFQTSEYVVSYYLTEKNAMSISTVILVPGKLSALASGGVDGLQLVDAKLKISVLCQK